MITAIMHMYVKDIASACGSHSRPGSTGNMASIDLDLYIL